VKRLAAIASLVIAAVVVAVAAGCGASGVAGSDTYRVDALFDNASFVVPGQDVRIAGVNAGSIKDVRVTPDNHARIEMEVDKRFAPFRSDADCFIAPQSLIGERFVQCMPGTPRGEQLRADGDVPPTVPLDNTHSPVDPDVVLSTFDMPVRERLQVILSELGVGLAGNGHALSDAIRRSNPAIQSAQDVLRIVNDDRDVLGRLIDRSDDVIGQLAQRRDRVASFIEEANKVSQTAAERRGAVSEGIRRLPETLDETRTSLDTLRELANRSRPLLGDLRTATPSLTRLVDDVPPLADAARPALKRLGAMAKTGTSALGEGAPVVKDLRRFASLAVPVGKLVADLNESMRERGAVEGLQFFVYNIALSISRYDGISHILPAYLVAPPGCAVFATTTNPSCSAHFNKGAGSAMTPLPPTSARAPCCRPSRSCPI
jgi:virulence factor Mce-like protein